MYLEHKNYNLILDKNGEGFIGYKNDMIKYYKDFAKELIDFLNKDFDNVYEIIDLLAKLEKVEDNYLLHVDYGYNQFEIKIISKEV